MFVDKKRKKTTVVRTEYNVTVDGIYKKRGIIIGQFSRFMSNLFICFFVRCIINLFFSYGHSALCVRCCKYLQVS